MDNFLPDEAKRRRESEVIHTTDEENIVPENFLCSITHEIMIDPVVASDGYIYDESALVKWISKNGTSPLTREPMTNKDWFAESVLKDDINSWLLANPDQKFTHKLRSIDEKSVVSESVAGGTVPSSSDSSSGVTSKDSAGDRSIIFYKALFVGLIIVLAIAIFILPKYLADSQMTLTNSPTTSPAISSTTSSNVRCPQSNTVSINFSTGSHPSELVWEVISSTTKRVVVKGGDTYVLDQKYQVAYCLPDDCYFINIYDVNEDSLKNCSNEMNETCVSIVYNEEEIMNYSNSPFDAFSSSVMFKTCKMDLLSMNVA